MARRLADRVTALGDWFSNRRWAVRGWSILPHATVASPPRLAVEAGGEGSSGRAREARRRLSRALMFHEHGPLRGERALEGGTSLAAGNVGAQVRVPFEEPQVPRSE